MLKRAILLLGPAMALVAACGSGPFPDAPKKPLPDDCSNPAVRDALGDQSAGPKTLRVRARIATNAAGELAVPTSRPLFDMVTLNAHFASANVQFLLVDVEELPPDDGLYDIPYGASPLCGGDLSSLSDDAIPILYVNTIDFGNGNKYGGKGNHCGAMMTVYTSYAMFGDLNGDFSDPETLTHELGHVLGLSHTHECYEHADYPENLTLNEDLVADTPYDPGPVGASLLSCASGALPGQCTVDPNSCAVDCADGSTPDVRNFMSYYHGCRSHFSAGQAVLIRCDVEKLHPGARCNNRWSESFGVDWEWASSFNGGYKSWHIADVDGDKKADALLHYVDDAPVTWEVALSNGTSFDEGSVWSVDHGRFADGAVGDVDGDGKADAIAVTEEGTWSVARSTGTSFAEPSIWVENLPGGYPYRRPLVADVNGDKRVDAISFDDATGRWSVALSTGTSFSTPVPWIEGFGAGSAGQYVADVDGDGKADAISFTDDDKWTPKHLLHVARSTGSSFEPPTSWFERQGRTKDVDMIFADIDADGKADAIRYLHRIAGWSVSLSTGTSFAEGYGAAGGLGQGIWFPGFEDQAQGAAGDMDGDGKADFVAFDFRKAIWTTNLCR
ncbi:FG-GAP-like repeat-containing protein [Polyangium sorediatum]|uniref:FG-GAP-like repeat-containing protein n=1 Tax=Polyangium sorediatum TaxID=889274 RepID=A0ABT6NY28_9BACT|nr:FG-GAP-like repeat-containing protein [Polyangium sorediatum]MDI1433209.1 FG-GAP-like repeat-containing protein [Polyangium sorediatum]